MQFCSDALEAKWALLIWPLFPWSVQIQVGHNTEHKLLRRPSATLSVGILYPRLALFLSIRGLKKLFQINF